MKYSPGQRMWYEQTDGVANSFGVYGLESVIKDELSKADTKDVFAINFFDQMQSYRDCLNWIATAAKSPDDIDKARHIMAKWGAGAGWIKKTAYEGAELYGDITTIQNSHFSEDVTKEPKQEGMLFVPINWLVSVDKNRYTVMREDMIVCVENSRFD